MLRKLRYTDKPPVKKFMSAVDVGSTFVRLQTPLLLNTIPTNNQKIFVAKVRDYELENVKREFEALYDVAKEMLKVDTVRKMKEIVPEFKSQNSVYCTLDK